MIRALLTQLFGDRFHIVPRGHLDEYYCKKRGHDFQEVTVASDQLVTSSTYKKCVRCQETRAERVANSSANAHQYWSKS